MSLYVIVAVRKEPLSGHVAYVRWGPSAACRLVSEPVTAAASEVIELIRQGRKWRRHSAWRARRWHRGRCAC